VEIFVAGFGGRSCNETKVAPRLFPLPGGEGQGEGETNDYLHSSIRMVVPFTDPASAQSPLRSLSEL